MEEVPGSIPGQALLFSPKDCFGRKCSSHSFGCIYFRPPGVVSMRDSRLLAITLIQPPSQSDTAAARGKPEAVAKTSGFNGVATPTLTT